MDISLSLKENGGHPGVIIGSAVGIDCVEPPQ